MVVVILHLLLGLLLLPLVRIVTGDGYVVAACRVVEAVVAEVSAAQFGVVLSVCATLNLISRHLPYLDGIVFRNMHNLIT